MALADRLLSRGVDFADDGLNPGTLSAVRPITVRQVFRQATLTISFGPRSLINDDRCRAMFRFHNRAPSTLSLDCDRSAPGRLPALMIPEDGGIGTARRLSAVAWSRQRAAFPDQAYAVLAEGCRAADHSLSRFRTNSSITSSGVEAPAVTPAVAFPADIPASNCRQDARRYVSHPAFLHSEANSPVLAE